jgi:glyceraldehyde-3-phosphate dehydrogenase [NAD(P)+]
MTTRTLRRRECPYIADEWVDTDDTLQVADVADGGTFTRIHAASVEDANRALASAERAEEELRQTTIPERAAWCEKIAAKLRGRADELAETIVREAGKPISSARGEVESAAERFDRAAEEVRALTGEFRDGTTEGHDGWEALVKFEPIGTVLCIAPYNYPLATTALQVAPALAAGNAVVLKPASKTPVSGAILTEIIADTDLPDGAFNFVPGRASVVGDTLVSDDRVNTIAMTGSSDAGKHVADESGMANLHMELGGNAPAVVFPDADIDDAARACAKGSFKYAGQRCSAVSRILAHEDVHDTLVRQLGERMDDWTIGDLFDEETAVGPLISEDQAAWVEELVDDALERGAKLVCGGEREGSVYRPTLLADVPRGARIVREEQFGPVAAVASFETEAEALEVANDTDLALDGCVFTSEYDRAMRVADELDAGTVRINGAPSHGLGDIPFGGNGTSGIGREGLGVTIREMVRKKSIVL